jgi:F-type H+-transporting ATPase subunit gamma
MSKRRQILTKLQSLHDLGEVFSAMKNLALAEISRLEATQRAREHLREELANVARAVAPAFSEALTDDRERDDLYVIIGSERGFCGAFDEPLVATWRNLAKDRPGDCAIVVGLALSEKMADAAGIVATLSGPTIAEDLDATLTQVLHAIRVAQSCRPAPMGVKAIWMSTEGVVHAAILPFAPPAGAAAGPLPDFYLRREIFVRDFIDQYVDATLHEAFCTSLSAENRARMAHMTAALEHVEQRDAELRQRANRLRQEEITETIETILLSTLVSWSRL